MYKEYGNFRKYGEVLKPLAHGITVVSDIDADLLQYAWQSIKAKKARTCYVSRQHVVGNQNPVTYSLHRTIAERMIGRPLEKGEVVDHIDGNGMNNTRYNLRVCSPKENARNLTRLRSNNTSGVTGVHWNTASGKWIATISLTDDDGYRRTFHLGTFVTLREASDVRLRAQIKHHGEFAPKNPPRKE